MHYLQHNYYITSLFHQIQKTHVQLSLPDNPYPNVLNAIYARLDLANEAERRPVLGLPNDRQVQRIPRQRCRNQELIQMHQHRPDVQFRREEYQRH